MRGLPDLFIKTKPLYNNTTVKKTGNSQWLISERPTDARDNGYFLFKWIRENHPEVNVCYAIRKDSQDYQKVKSLGRVLEWGSYEHYKSFLTSTLLCSTDFGLCAPNSRIVKLVRNFMPVKGHKVFLQHGITKDNIRHGHQDKMGVSLFVCGAYPEWEYIDKNFGYSKGEAKYLGFARYDNLFNTTTKKQILYMPTWRFWLREEGGFESSNYYKALCSFLGSDKLRSILNESQSEFVFFVHPAMREKKDYFKQLETDRIKIMNNDDIDLQVLLKSCSMLITDYSSIYFDVAYLNKPVVYYQFDVEEYRRRQYAEGYFSYERDGFGPVIKKEDEILSYLSKCARNEFENSAEYASRVNRFFPLRDHNNCQRHYEELCKLDPYNH